MPLRTGTPNTMKLRKEICQMCHKKDDWWDDWKLTDEENWNNGTVFCIHVEHNEKRMKIEVPKSCPYTLEYLTQ